MNIGGTVLQGSLHTYTRGKQLYSRTYQRPLFTSTLLYSHRARCLRLLRCALYSSFCPPSLLFSHYRASAAPCFYGRRISMTGLKEDAHGERKKGSVLWQWSGYKNLRKVVPLMGTSEANCWMRRNNLLFIGDLNCDFSHRNWRCSGVNGFQQTRRICRELTRCSVNWIFYFCWNSYTNDRCSQSFLFIVVIKILFRYLYAIEHRFYVLMCGLHINHIKKSVSFDYIEFTNSVYWSVTKYIKNNRNFHFMKKKEWMNIKIVSFQ